MISIIRLHSYLCPDSTATELISYCNQATPKWGSGYNYTSDTLNHSPQEGKTARFSLPVELCPQTNEVSCFLPSAGSISTSSAAQAQPWSMVRLTTRARVYLADEVLGWLKEQARR